MTKRIMVINDEDRQVTEVMPIDINPDYTVDINVPLKVDVYETGVGELDFHANIQSSTMLLNWAGFYAWDGGKIKQGFTTVDSRYNYYSAWSDEMWAQVILTDGFSDGQQVILQCFPPRRLIDLPIYVYVSEDESVELLQTEYCRVVWMGGKWNIIYTNGDIY